MKRFLVCVLVLGFLVITTFTVGDEKLSGDSKYVELFSFPSKISLDEKQKEKLTELVKEYGTKIRENDTRLASYTGKTAKRDLEGIDIARHVRYQVLREFTIKKIALLTDAQREALNIKVVTPDCVQEKALSDPKVWDIGQLEKHFTVLSRSFSPDEQVLSFVVITKKKWTEKERKSDTINWNTAKAKVLFYNKDEELLINYSSPNNELSIRFYVPPEIIRTEPRLTEKEAEAGMLKFRIKIDLAPGSYGEYKFANIKKAASAKFIYPEPKE